MYILNGATVGDEDGSLTFISGVGESVNDLCAVAHDLLKFVINFQLEIKQ